LIQHLSLMKISHVSLHSRSNYLYFKQSRQQNRKQHSIRGIRAHGRSKGPMSTGAEVRSKWAFPALGESAIAGAGECQAASRKAHPWAYEAGELFAQAPMLRPSLAAKLGQRAIGAVVGGVTEAVTQPEA
jgi:hypothetical protein